MGSRENRKKRGGGKEERVKQTSQRGVEKERLYSDETVCKPGKCSLQWKPEVGSTETEGRPPCIEKVPVHIPSWSSFMQWGFQICTILIGRHKCKWGYNCTFLIGQGRPQSIDQKMKLGLPVVVDSRHINKWGIVQKAKSSVFPVWRVYGEPLSANGL